MLTVHRQKSDNSNVLIANHYITKQTYDGFQQYV